MKKYVLFAFIALFFVSSSVWADTAYVKVTDGWENVSWIEIRIDFDGTNIEISRNAIDENTKGSIDLNEMWSENDGSGTHYQVTSIGQGAFFFCEGLTSVEIPNSVTSIGESAFWGCSGLTSVTIPNSVTSIGQGAFSSCLVLTSINIPNSVTSIGDYAFESCTGLTSVTIPNSVTSIGGSAFSGCTGCTSIVVESGNPVYDSRNNCNAIIETASNTLIAGCENTIIPNSVTTIGQSAFDGCSSLTSVTIPNSVTSIGQSAFDSCSGLTSVTIPNSVTNIGQDAFWGCTSVTDVYCHALPNQLTWNEADCDDFNWNGETQCHVYDADEWKEFEGIVNVTFVGDLMLKLEANADNTDAIACFENDRGTVELAERTFLTDGRWTTLCLPFSVPSLAGTPLEGFTVKELDTSTAVDGHTTGLKDGTLYLNFKDATSIEAGKPYVVRKTGMSGDIGKISCTATSGTRAATGTQDATFDYRGLVDGSVNRRWRTNAPPDGGSNFCEFHAQEPVVVTHYELVSTNLKDTSNPTVWTLKGKLNEEDEWTVIDSRNVNLNPGDALGIATSTKQYYISTENMGAYRFFRFDVTKINGGSVMVISELKLYDAKAEHSIIENPLFKEVTIQNTAPTVVSSNDGKVSFVGSYAPVSGGNVICLGSNNRLQPLGKGKMVDALHAVFVLNGGKGDVNGDGDIDISDVVALVNIILSDGTDENSSADVNGDGSVDISDVVALVNNILSDNSPSIPKIDKVVTNVGIGY